MPIIISLAAHPLTDSVTHPIVVGARSCFKVIDMRDLAELLGIVFRPGGLAPWLRHRADAFSEQSVPLGQVWSDRDLRERLMQEKTPEQKLAKLDALLVESLRGREVAQRPLVKSALLALPGNSVKQTAQSLGVGERRLHQVFCEDVGLSPKLLSRVHAFNAR